jgi:hypothetical protein
MIKQIQISKRHNFIIVTRFGEEVLHYHMDNLDTVNRNCDIGIWRVKYKSEQKKISKFQQKINEMQLKRNLNQ